MPKKGLTILFFVTIESSKSISNLYWVIEVENYIKLDGHFVKNCIFVICVILKVIGHKMIEVLVDFSWGLVS